MNADNVAAGRRRGGKLAYVVIGLVVGVCAIGWGIIVGFSAGTPGIVPQVVSYTASDTSVRVRYRIAKPKGQDVHCALVALDVHLTEVGRVAAPAPEGERGVDRTRTIPTSAHAATVDIRECRTG